MEFKRVGKPKLLSKAADSAVCCLCVVNIGEGEKGDDKILG
jgi:hypothetical protein